MAYGDATLTYKDAGDVAQDTRSRKDAGQPHIPGVVVYDPTGAAVDSAHPLSVKIEADVSGSSIVAEDESIPRADAKAALAAAILYGADGLNVTTGDRKIVYVFGGAAAVSEVAAKGTATCAVVTVDATTVNGVQLVAANATGTRRRVIVTQRGAVQVEVYPGNITASSGKGRALPAVVGAEQTWFIQGTLRATCASGTQEVTVTEEILGS